MHVLIVGGDGAIGAALADTLRAGGHEVTATTRRAAANGDALFFDLAAPDLSVLPDADVTVISAAMARFEDCRKQPDLARQVNVTAPAALAVHMRARGKRVVLLSTSAVFDCLKPLRKADEVHAPRSTYGRFKAEAEQQVLALGAGMSVLRLTKVVRAEQGVFPGWISALAAGQSVTAFNDHALCPLPMAAVVDALVAVVTQGGDGVFQVSGADDVTYAAAARDLAGDLGVPEGRVNEVTAAQASLLPEEITPFTSLDTTRLSAMTGFVPPKAREVLRAVYGPAMATVRA